MREIEFRGRTKRSGEWIVGSLLAPFEGNGAVIFREGETAALSRGGAIYPGWVSVDPDTVGQYTGLRDKNGKKIYEGDILGADNNVIGWVNGGVRGYCYDVVYIKKDVNDPPFSGDKRWSLYSTVQYDYPDMIEVIGNIHDNPELIK